MDALRIRMEGGMERIEAATADARRLSRRLRRAAGPISGLFVGKRSLADEIASFLRGQPAVEEAVDRLAKLVILEGMTEGTDPRVLREWRDARGRLGERAAKACEALAASSAGSVLEDLRRVEDQLRGPPPVPALPVASPLTPSPATPLADGRFGMQWAQYRAQHGWGAIVNSIGPITIAAMAIQGAAAGTVAMFFLWGAANVRWIRQMARWPCPSCGKPFAQWRVVFAPYCEHCGLKKFEGDQPKQLGP